MKVCWISAGVSSFIAGYLERESVDKYKKGCHAMLDRIWR